MPSSFFLSSSVFYLLVTPSRPAAIDSGLPPLAAYPSKLSLPEWAVASERNREPTLESRSRVAEALPDGRFFDGTPCR